METLLSAFSVTAMLFCLGIVSTSAQTAVGGAQHRGASAPSQQTRTMSTPRPGAAGGAAGVGGPQATAPKAVSNAPQAAAAKQNGKSHIAPSK
jgi:hypothetical protein